MMQGSMGRWHARLDGFLGHAPLDCLLADAWLDDFLAMHSPHTTDRGEAALTVVVLISIDTVKRFASLR
jgi:hypothetical protein